MGRSIYFNHPIETEVCKMRIGYIRVSTEEQNTARQEVIMSALGVDEICCDTIDG